MRILIKLSGESLSGSYGQGLDFDYIDSVVARIKRIHDMGVGIGIVCGGGNFLRGRDTTHMDRETADYVGMLATVMNSLVLKDAFTRIGIGTYNQSGLGVAVADSIDSEKANQAINDGKIVIYGGGVGKPFFSTDTGAALRAIDIKADIIVKLTNVDGVYDKDPNKYGDAKMYDNVSYEEVIDKRLGVMDLEAIRMCQDNHIKIVVMNIEVENGLIKLINGEKIGTLVSDN